MMTDIDAFLGNKGCYKAPKSCQGKDDVPNFLAFLKKLHRQHLLKVVPEFIQANGSC